VGGLGSSGAGEDLVPASKMKFEVTGACDLCSKGNNNLGGADGADERITDEFTGFDPGFLAGFELVEGKRNGGNRGEDGKNWKEDGEDRLDGNAPELVIF